MEKDDQRDIGPRRNELFFDCIVDNHNEHLPQAFTHLVETVQACHLCPRMEGRVRVLSMNNGPINADVMFIAEAPGRLGANRIGIPLSGDQTGRNFDTLLQVAQIDRNTVFITNAILCNPQSEQGYNATPTSLEINNCSRHLAKTIELLQPRFVVTLGLVALNALRHIEDHQCILSQHVGIPHLWYQRWLIPLYHPGPRARVHRSVELQQSDFHRLGTFIRNEMVVPHRESE